ncbi:hypothetical protein FHG87_019512 [Trinorchestia longiramus]|nr:hypothetical protein FHG87_019512 [Trinorchestia longiramus]
MSEGARSPPLNSHPHLNHRPSSSPSYVPPILKSPHLDLLVSTGERYVYKFVCDPETLITLGLGTPTTMDPSHLTRHHTPAHHHHHHHHHTPQQPRHDFTTQSAHHQHPFHPHHHQHHHPTQNSLGFGGFGLNQPAVAAVHDRRLRMWPSHCNMRTAVAAAQYAVTWGTGGSPGLSPHVAAWTGSPQYDLSHYTAAFSPKFSYDVIPESMTSFGPMASQLSQVTSSFGPMATQLSPVTSFSSMAASQLSPVTSSYSMTSNLSSAMPAVDDLHRDELKFLSTERPAYLQYTHGPLTMLPGTSPPLSPTTYPHPPLPEDHHSTPSILGGLNSNPDHDSMPLGSEESNVAKLYALHGCVR